MRWRQLSERAGRTAPGGQKERGPSANSAVLLSPSWPLIMTKALQSRFTSRWELRMRSTHLASVCRRVSPANFGARFLHAPQWLCSHRVRNRRPDA